RQNRAHRPRLRRLQPPCAPARRLLSPQPAARQAGGPAPDPEGEFFRPHRATPAARPATSPHPDDTAPLGLYGGQWVDLTSHFEGEQRRAFGFKVVPYEIPRRCAAAYYPEANPLVHLRNVAVGSNQPASKSILIT